MSTDGTVKAWPKFILQAEAAAIFGSSLWAYSRTGYSWWVFLGGIFLPDLGMAGYIANTSVGAATYNTMHTETPGILLLCLGYARRDARMSAAALVWLAHVGFDRMCGFGLKYGSFGHTHLGNIEKPGAGSSR